MLLGVKKRFFFLLYFPSIFKVYLKVHERLLAQLFFAVIM
jgi:hypothetical protein